MTALMRLHEYNELSVSEGNDGWARHMGVIVSHNLGCNLGLVVEAFLLLGTFDS